MAVVANKRNVVRNKTARVITSTSTSLADLLLPCTLLHLDRCAHTQPLKPLTLFQVEEHFIFAYGSRWILSIDKFMTSKNSINPSYPILLATKRVHFGFIKGIKRTSHNSDYNNGVVFNARLVKYSPTPASAPIRS